MTTLADDLVACRGLIHMPELSCRYNFSNEVTPLSLARAMHLALNGATGPGYLNRYRAMSKAITDARGSQLPWQAWSQHPLTTHADIMAVLDAAIERASI